MSLQIAAITEREISASLKKLIYIKLLVFFLFNSNRVAVIRNQILIPTLIGAPIFNNCILEID